MSQQAPDVEAEDKARTYHHGNLRETLLELACQHVKREGIDSLSLRALAREAGVSATAPYRHFKDRQVLINAIITEGLRHLQQHAELEIDKANPDVMSKLRQFGRAYVNFAREHEQLFRLMFNCGHEAANENTETHDEGEAAYMRLRDLVARGIDEGIIRDVSPEAITNALWAGVHGMAMLIIDRCESFFDESEIDAQTDFMLDTMLAGIARRN